MIICGYPGIGKSTIAKSEENVVDLESSIFRTGKDSVRPLLWEKYYCDMAIELSKQGNTVFVSTHTEVISYLEEHCDEPVIVMYPVEDLRDEWVERLKTRYEKSGSDKDFRAYISTNSEFNERVKALRNSKFGCIEITSMEYKYSLRKFLDKLDRFYGNLPVGFRAR